VGQDHVVGGGADIGVEDEDRCQPERTSSHLDGDEGGR
jgi:hypothetical protein